MKLTVLTKPDSTLYCHSEPVDFEVMGIDERRKFADNLLATMREVDGAIGLAAPQVGHLIRVIAIKKCPEDLVMFNPVIVEKSDREVGWAEACLSCPGVSVVVKRPKWCVVEWREDSGEPRRQRFTHLDARVVQHEIDHLNGKLIAP